MVPRAMRQGAPATPSEYGEDVDRARLVAKIKAGPFDSCQVNARVPGTNCLCPTRRYPTRHDNAARCLTGGGAFVVAALLMQPVACVVPGRRRPDALRLPLTGAAAPAH